MDRKVEVITVKADPALIGFLLAMSFIFYAWGEQEYIWLLLLSLAVNYAGALGIEAVRGSRPAATGAGAAEAGPEAIGAGAACAPVRGRRAHRRAGKALYSRGRGRGRVRGSVSGRRLGGRAARHSLISGGTFKHAFPFRLFG